MAVKLAEVETKWAKGQVLEAQYMKGKRQRGREPAYVQIPWTHALHGHASLEMVIHEGKSDKGTLATSMPSVLSQSPVAPQH